MLSIWLSIVKYILVEPGWIFWVEMCKVKVVINIRRAFDELPRGAGGHDVSSNQSRSEKC
jgi:hypothetical protein